MRLQFSKPPTIWIKDRCVHSTKPRNPWAAGRERSAKLCFFRYQFCTKSTYRRDSELTLFRVSHPSSGSYWGDIAIEEISELRIQNEANTSRIFLNWSRYAHWWDISTMLQGQTGGISQRCKVRLVGYLNDARSDADCTEPRHAPYKQYLFISFMRFRRWNTCQDIVFHENPRLCFITSNWRVSVGS